jgi:hypothetical protein
VSLLLSGTQAGAKLGIPPPAPTQLATATGSATATSIATGSVSPASNSLLVASVRRVTGGTLAMQTTLANVGSWTISSPASTAASQLWIAWAVITGAPGSGTVTADWGADSQAARSIHLIQVTKAGTPGSVTNGTVSTAGTTFSVDLGSPAPTDLMIAVLNYEGNSSITEGANWDELAETSPASTRRMQTQSATGLDQADGVADWSALIGGTSRNAAGLIIPAG